MFAGVIFDFCIKIEIYIWGGGILMNGDNNIYYIIYNYRIVIVWYPPVYIKMVFYANVKNGY